MSVLTSVSTGKRLCVVSAQVLYNVLAGSYQAQARTAQEIVPSLEAERVAGLSKHILEPLSIWLALRAALNDATPCERSQRINRRNVGKSVSSWWTQSPTSSNLDLIGKESGSATVSATGLQRLPDKKPRQGVIIPARGSYLLRKSLRSAFPYVPNTARNGHLLSAPL